MSEILNLTPGLQCCLLCGRTLTDRALHDRLEESVLASIRAEHPEWSDGDGACQPCIQHYRKLLSERMGRAERLRAPARRRIPRWMVHLLGQTTDTAMAEEAVG